MRGVGLASPDSSLIARILRARLSLEVDAAQLCFQRRGSRWLALTDTCALLVAADGGTWLRLGVEARLLRALGAALGSCVPVVRTIEDQARLLVLSRLRGLSGERLEARIFGGPPPVDRYAPTTPLTAFGERLAADLGGALARLHGGLSIEAARDLGLGAVPAPDFAAIESALRAHDVWERLGPVLEGAARWSLGRPRDEVVLHDDPHLHNVFAEADGALAGLVDVGDAGVGDRYEDLRYLASCGPRFVEVALGAYARAAGSSIDAREVARAHVRGALDHFVWVTPGAPRAREIADWAEAAAVALTPDWLPA